MPENDILSDSKTNDLESRINFLTVQNDKLNTQFSSALNELHLNTSHYESKIKHMNQTIVELRFKFDILNLD